MRMKKIFMIRHGRQSSKLCNVDVGLSETGRRQAELAAARLSGYGIERLYSSDLKRAVETADVIGRALGLVPEYRKEFREIDFGELTGKDDDTIAREYREFREERRRQTSDLPYPGGECGADVVARALPLFLEICRDSGDRAAVVTHGGLIRALCAQLLETDMKNKLKFAVDLENTGITEIIYDREEGVFYMERFNDYAHLEPYPELLRSSWNSSWLLPGKEKADHEA